MEFRKFGIAISNQSLLYFGKNRKPPIDPLNAGVCDVSAPFGLELSHCRGHVWDLVGR